MADFQLDFNLSAGSNPTKWIKANLQNENFVRSMDAQFHTHDLNKLSGIFDGQIKKQGLDSTRLKAGHEYKLNFEDNSVNLQRNSIYTQPAVPVITKPKADSAPIRPNPFSSEIKDAKPAEYKPEVEKPNLNPKKISDGKIGNFKQGSTGDCWLLAGIKGSADSPIGKEIIKNSIKRRPDGNFEVTFKGAPGKVFTVTKEELGRKGLSTGDVDVRILERAAEKFYVNDDPERRAIKGKNILDGGYNHQATNLILGKGSYYNIDKSDKDNNAKIMDLLRDKAKDENTILIVSFDKTDKTVLDKHAYSVRSVDEQAGIVRLINPHDTSKTTPVKLKDFLNNVNSIGYVKGSHFNF